MGSYVYYEYLNKIINFDDEYKRGEESIIWIYSVVVVVVGAINFRNYSRRGNISSVK